MMKYPTWDANKKMSILNESYAESVVVSDIAWHPWRCESNRSCADCSVLCNGCHENLR